MYHMCPSGAQVTYKRLRETLQSLQRVAGGDGAASGLVEVLFGRRAPRFQQKLPPWKATNKGACHVIMTELNCCRSVGYMSTGADGIMRMRYEYGSPRATVISAYYPLTLVRMAYPNSTGESSRCMVVRAIQGGNGNVQ